MKAVRSRDAWHCHQRALLRAGQCIGLKIVSFIENIVSFCVKYLIIRYLFKIWLTLISQFLPFSPRELSAVAHDFSSIVLCNNLEFPFY